MAVYKLARYVVRPDARDRIEPLLHELATQVRGLVPKTMTTTYRDAHATDRYMTLLIDSRPDTERAFVEALRPLVEGEIDFHEHQLVTSSDLAPRPRDPKARRRPR